MPVTPLDNLVQLSMPLLLRVRGFILRPRRFCVMTALLALLAGCATQPAMQPGASDSRQIYSERQGELQQLTEWMAFGRLALKTPTQSLQAKVQWKQLADVYRIRITGPLGSGALQLAGAPGRVEIRNAKNEVAYARRPEDLLQEQVGWSVPLTGLRYWLMGRPEPGSVVKELAVDSEGRLERLEQAGWVIRYLRYDSVGKWQLPTKVFLENERVSARFVLSQWQA